MNDLAQLPVLKKILKEKGSLSCEKYFEESFHTPPAGLPTDRMQEFLSVVNEEIKKNISEETAESAIQQLKKNYYVSTAEHHIPLGHSFFLNGHILQSIVNKQKGYPNIIVLACSGIPLNNDSFPRGILFHSKNKKQERLYLMSLKHKHQPIWATKAYTQSAIEHAKKDVQKKHIDDETKIHVQQLINTIYGSPEIYALKTYGEQITATNFTLWRSIPGEEKTNLLYLEVETIISRLIVRHHLHHETPLSRILFSKEGQEAFQKYYADLPGAFKKDKSQGTHLFWDIAENKLTPLFMHDGVLQGKDGVQIRLDPITIRDLLTARKIMPSLALSYTMLAFYYGLSCGGGYAQVNYLPAMKRAYHNILTELGVQQEKFIDAVDTAFLSSDFITLNPARPITPTAIDLATDPDNNKIITEVRRAAETTTIAQSIAPLLKSLS